MNELLQKFRQQYPEYDDMSDADLARALHSKFYMDMSFPEFAEKIGLATPEEQEREAAEMRVAQSGSPVGDFLHMMAEGATGGTAVPPAGSMPSTFARPDDPRWNPEVRQRARDEFQQRTDDLQLLNPSASTMAGAAGVVGSLGPALSAIRAARGAGMAPGLRDIRPLLMEGGALARLRALAGHPLLRYGGGTAAAIEGVRRLF